MYLASLQLNLQKIMKLVQSWFSNKKDLDKNLSNKKVHYNFVKINSKLTVNNDKKQVVMKTIGQLVNYRYGQNKGVNSILFCIYSVSNSPYV